MKELAKIKDSIIKAKPKFEAINNAEMLDFAKESSFAYQILQGNSYLASANQESIVNAIVNIARIGLTLNPALKLAYLVPRKINKELHCILDVSYMGMIKILTDAGAVKNMTANVVYEKDFFDHEMGTNAFLKHKKTFAKERGEKYASYAIAYFRDGGSQFDIMRRDEVEQIMKSSEAYKSDKEKGTKYSPWMAWEDEMWKKTPIKRLFKFLPKKNLSDEVIAMIANEHYNELADLSESNTKNEKYADIFEDADVVETKEPERKSLDPASFQIYINDICAKKTTAKKVIEKVEKEGIIITDDQKAEFFSVESQLNP